MWNNNLTVNRTYTSAHPKNGWAILNGVAGWKKISPISTDGVSNVLSSLNAAKANSRPVDVYIVSNQIERVVLR